jgi:hypothetical protein
MKEYIIIENEKVIAHQASEVIPKNAIEVNSFQGHVGIEIKYLSKDYKTLLSESELISKGIVKDNRGVYYNKTTLEKKEITQLDVEIEDDYTKEIPTSQFDEWNENKFEINIEKLRAYRLKELDATYNQYILTLYPIEKQMKMTMYYNSLLNKEIKNTITTAEQAEKTQLEDLHRWYIGLLAKHETDKIYLQIEMDLDKLKNYIIKVE